MNSKHLNNLAQKSKELESEVEILTTLISDLTLKVLNPKRF